MNHQYSAIYTAYNNYSFPTSGFLLMSPSALCFPVKLSLLFSKIQQQCHPDLQSFKFAASDFIVRACGQKHFLAVSPNLLAEQ